MSIDNLGILGKEELARRNLWEATLYNEAGQALSWSTGLIKSVVSPRLSFMLENCLGGTHKSYASWKLPESIQLSIWETSDHRVERYLDSWMTGKNGVFDMNKSQFRAQTMSSLYRKFVFKTFIYKLPAPKAYSEDIGGSISDKLRPPGSKVIIEQKQYIPVVDKLASAAGSLANRLVASVPLSNVTRAFMPPVVIPPPLMKKVVDISVLNGVSKPTKPTPKLPSTPAVEVEKSRITYTVAIESYDVGIYEYSSGEGVSYTVNLAVCDISTGKSSDSGESTQNIAVTARSK